jgi:hypothetical protein
MARAPGPKPDITRWPASRFSVILPVPALFVFLFAGPLRTDQRDLSRRWRRRGVLEHVPAQFDGGGA